MVTRPSRTARKQTDEERIERKIDALTAGMEQLNKAFSELLSKVRIAPSERLEPPIEKSANEKCESPPSSSLEQ